jgi:F-type H+-transporting ATPase subunit epsilon
VELTTSEGDIGVYKQHIPMTCILVPGLVKIYETENGEPKFAVVHGGFVQILEDKVTIMAEVAEWPEEIDENRAKEAQVRAERRLAMKDPNINLQRAELALHRALIRQEVKQNKR